MRTFFLVSFCFLLFSSFAEDYRLFEENGKYGLKDEQGKVVISPSFEGLGWSDGSFSVIGQVTGYKVRNKWGLINLKAQQITEANYISLLPSGGDRVIIKKAIDPVTTKMGCMDLKGNIKVPPKYDGIRISGLRAIVFVKSGSQYNYGVIDLEGNIIIPLEYKSIAPIGDLRYRVQNIENRSALFSESGNRLTQFNIDSISTFKNNKAIIYRGLSLGIINRDGKIEAEPQYREITFEDSGSIKARQMANWILMDKDHNALKTIACDELVPYTSGFIVHNGNQYGVWDNDFKPILPVDYDEIQKLDGDLAVVKHNRKTGLIQFDNSVVIPIQYDSIILNEKFVRVKERLLGKPSWALYDIYGIRKSERTYESILGFNGQFFLIKNYGLSGIMDRYGKETVHCLYDSIINFNENQIVVKFHGHYGIIDFKENWLLPPQPFPVQIVNEDYYLQYEYGSVLFKNFRGDLIYFTDNPLRVKEQLLKEVLPDGTEKEINFQGITVSRTTPPVMEDVEIVAPEYEGLRAIKRNGKYGFIDQKGRLRIANRYEAIGNFHHGLAAVKILGKWGFINAQDKIAINPSYESVSEFSNNVAIVKRGKFGFVDRNGNLILEPRYDSIQPIRTGNFLLIKNNLFGLADENGVVLIEPRFDTLKDLGNGYVIVSRDRKFGLLTRKGLSTIPMIYHQLYYLEHQDKYLAKKMTPWTTLDLN